jgi:hypothetical protein
VFEVVVIDLTVVMLEIDKLMIKEMVIIMRLEEEVIKTLINSERTINNDREQIMWTVADVEVW